MKLEDILSEGLSSEEFYQRVKSRHLDLISKGRPSVKDQATYINENLPKVKERIVAEANELLEGMMVLPGTDAKPYFVGNPPDWFNNPVNHNEYTFHLNRMNQWKPLLEAFTLTGDQRYAKRVIDELNDWIEKCPRPDITKDIELAYKSFNSVDPWRSLECGIRNFKNWPWVIHHLIGTELMTPELLEKYAISVFGQGEVLAEVCPMFWPLADHNHYLMENLGLLAIVCNFPEFKTAQKWREHAVRELERCAKAQITEDGGQIEGCPSYHNGCVYWFSLSILLAREYGITFSDDYVSRIRKSLDYSIYSTRPSGTVVPWGDSSTGKGIISAAFYGYLAFNSVEWLSFATKFVSVDEIKRVCVKEIWNIKDIGELLSQIENLQDYETSLPTVSWQHELKQVAMRTGWDKDAISILFACRTPIQNNHAHIDPMSFDLTAFGRPLVVDPGKFTYKEDENRRNFKSAQWHNTLTIDEKPPFEYISSWRYGPQKYGNITKMVDDKSLMYAEAEHFNYEPAIHKRVLAIIDREYTLVLDKVTAINPDSTVQLYYHMDCGKVTLDANKNCVHTANGDSEVVIYISDNLKGELLPGKVSDSNDTSRESIRLCARDSASGKDLRLYATVIVPYKAEADVPKVADLLIKEENQKVCCSFSLNDKVYEFVWDEIGLNKL